MSDVLGENLLRQECEAAAQAIHDALCRDRLAPWSECRHFDIFGAAVDAVLAVRDVHERMPVPSDDGGGA